MLRPSASEHARKALRSGAGRRITKGVELGGLDMRGGGVEPLRASRRSSCERRYEGGECTVAFVSFLSYHRPIVLVRGVAPRNPLRSEVPARAW